MTFTARARPEPGASRTCPRRAGPTRRGPRARRRPPPRRRRGAGGLPGPGAAVFDCEAQRALYNNAIQTELLWRTLRPLERPGRAQTVALQEQHAGLEAVAAPGAQRGENDGLGVPRGSLAPSLCTGAYPPRARFTRRGGAPLSETATRPAPTWVRPAGCCVESSCRPRYLSTKAAGAVSQPRRKPGANCPSRTPPGWQAPGAPIQKRHTQPVYYGKREGRLTAPGGPGPSWMRCRGGSRGPPRLHEPATLKKPRVALCQMLWFERTKSECSGVRGGPSSRYDGPRPLRPGRARSPRPSPPPPPAAAPYCR
jgi:hypothetical protein